ncbi:MAG: radical SAM protein [Verrucomicrobiaceae bacterium]
MTLGLIAISGLRVCDSEFLAKGLTFPSLGNRAKQIEALPSLGLLTLAGLTPPEIKIEYLEVRDVDLDNLPHHFDAVALSTLTATAKESYRLAARFREIGTTVILGGLHATLNPLEAQEHVDCLAIGEGEVIWPQMMTDLLANKLQPTYNAQALGPFDFANSPTPRFDLLQPDRYPRFTVQTQRGCPLSCEFCAASMRLSPKFRVKPVDRVIAEIRLLKDLYQRPFIEFADDNTFVDKRHGKALMRALAKEDVRWFTESDVSVADDEDLLKMIRDAGCQQILIGFESPNFTALDGVEKNSNWKARRTDRYLRAVETIQKHGITVNGCFIFGMDGDGPESFGNVLDFVEKSGLYDVQMTYLTPFPGTPLHQRLTEEGRILVQNASETCTLFDINFQPDSMSVEELRAGYLNLLPRIYGEEFVAQRYRNFRQHLRRKIKEDRSLKSG